MRITAAGILLPLAMAASALAAPARIAFDVVLPAPSDLHSVEELAVTRATGDPEGSARFVDEFVDQVNRSGLLRATDATHRSPAGAQAAVTVTNFACAAEVRNGEAGGRDQDGNRVRRVVVWVDTVCTARIDITESKGRRLASFMARGEGTSSRVDAINDDERRQAIAEAARYAAIDAAERITPRRSRESVELDESAPAFEEAMAMIRAGRPADARAIWERALRNEPRSAALHFDLAAVCEAAGDRVAAGQHYAAAHAIAPKDARFKAGLEAFERREKNEEH